MELSTYLEKVLVLEKILLVLEKIQFPLFYGTCPYHYSDDKNKKKLLACF